MVLQQLLFCWPSDRRIRSSFRKRDLLVLPEDIEEEALLMQGKTTRTMLEDETTMSHSSSGCDEGALTPAVSNCYSKRTASTVASEIPHSPLSSGMALEELEEEERFSDHETDEDTLGDSWEPVEPDMDDLMEEEEEAPVEVEAPAFVLAMTAPVPGSVSSSASSEEEDTSTPVPVYYQSKSMSPSSRRSGSYSPPAVIYKAAPAVHEYHREPPAVYKSDKSMAYPKFFMLVTFLALLVGILSAAGVWEKLDLLPQHHKQQLDAQLVHVQQLKEQINARLPVVIQSIPLVYRPAVAYENSSTLAMARNATTKALPPPPPVEEDTGKYIWLSPDDDVLAGQVFWGTGDSYVQPPAFQLKKRKTRKEVRQDRLIVVEDSRPLRHGGSAVDRSEEPKDDENTATTKKTKLANLLDLSSFVDDQPYWTEKLELIQNIVHLYTANQTVNHQQQQKLRKRQQNPIHWLSQQYQRLNVYVLGQSQLAQLKRQIRYYR